jgi:hypothetical protein
MNHYGAAEVLRKSIDSMGWFSLLRYSVNATAIHLRTHSEPICILVTDGPVVSVLVGAPSPDKEILTYSSPESAIAHLRELADGK